MVSPPAGQISLPSADMTDFVFGMAPRVTVRTDGVPSATSTRLRVVDGPLNFHSDGCWSPELLAAVAVDQREVAKSARVVWSDGRDAGCVEGRGAYLPFETR